jgi:DNA-binding transcriptional MocR family regulator
MSGSTPQTQVPTTPADWLAVHVRDTSARGIAAAVTALVRNGDLAPESRLPTVRDLAAELGVSPGTVSGAWQLLRRRRIIATRRRGGSVVLGLPSAPHPVRFEQVGNFGTRSKVDLTYATPDPALLPPLEDALAAGLRNARLNTYAGETLTPALAEALETTWPFDPASWLVVNGGYEGVQLLCQTSFGGGELVAVEDPTAPRLLDILSVVDADVIPVECDAEGPDPESLRRAVNAGAVGFLYQPRAHTPCGHGVTAARSRALAEVLDQSGVLVIEDDGLADVARPELHSLGRFLPDTTVLVRSFSKSHGPDLRIGVLGGAEHAIHRAQAFRNFGARWTSRLLQDALAHLLTSDMVRQQVAHARETYARRRRICVDALARAGIVVGGDDGFSLWVPVADESYALVTLAAHGISVSPGRQFFANGGQPHIRLATSRLPEDASAVSAVADAVGLAAAGPG